MNVILLKNNLNGSLVINVCGKSLVLDGGAQKEIPADALNHPQVQYLLNKKILSKIEKRG